MYSNFITKNKNLRTKSLRDNIKSHHTMGAFFSGQDINNLQEFANDTNCYLSLVVDTKGEYVAALTRKLHIEAEVITTITDYHYEFFGEGPKKNPDVISNSTTKKSTSEVIEYYMLEVTREAVDNPLDYLDRRFEEISRNKASERASHYYYGNDYDYDGWWKERTFGKDTFEENALEGKKPKQLSLFNEDEMEQKKERNKGKKKEPEKDLDEDYPKPDAKLIYQATARMLTCSLALNTDKFNMKTWINNHMDNVYEKTFGGSNRHEQESNIMEWVNFIVPFTIQIFKDPALDNYFIDEASRGEAIVLAMLDVLTPYEKKSYIYLYIDALNDWILMR